MSWFLPPVLLFSLARQSTSLEWHALCVKLASLEELSMSFTVKSYRFVIFFLCTLLFFSNDCKYILSQVLNHKIGKEWAYPIMHLIFSKEPVKVLKRWLSSSDHYCSHRGPGVESQHPPNASQSSVTPVLKHLMFSSALHFTGTHAVHTCVQAKYSCI